MFWCFLNVGQQFNSHIPCLKLFWNSSITKILFISIIKATLFAISGIWVSFVAYLRFFCCSVYIYVHYQRVSYDFYRPSSFVLLYFIQLRGVSSISHIHYTGMYNTCTMYMRSTLKHVAENSRRSFLIRSARIKSQISFVLLNQPHWKIILNHHHWINHGGVAFLCEEQL